MGAAASGLPVDSESVQGWNTGGVLTIIVIVIAILVVAAIAAVVSTTLVIPRRRRRSVAPPPAATLPTRTPPPETAEKVAEPGAPPVAGPPPAVEHPLLESPLVETTLETPEPTAGRMQRLRARLSRSQNVFGRGLLAVLARDRLDDEAWEEVEEALLSADVGVGATMEIVEHLRTRTQVAGTREPGELRAMLAEELVTRPAAPARPHPAHQPRQRRAGCAHGGRRERHR